MGAVDRGRNRANNPRGLGDPDDVSLRNIEHLIIERRIRRAAREKCRELMAKFAQCTNERGFLAPFQCRAENKAQVECLKIWFYDEELKKRLTEEYLRDRREYRETGIPKAV